MHLYKSDSLDKTACDMGAGVCSLPKNRFANTFLSLLFPLKAIALLFIKLFASNLFPGG